ncbi:MAG TPA: hypothetical protein VM925_21460, partial [Labilithrix sp.]|nr:hypothetical protein [Labilithrix sp.]
ARTRVMSGTRVVGGISAGVVALALAAACGENAADGKGSSGKSKTGKTAAATGLPCEVDTLLKTRCQTCHSAEPQYGARIPLVTWSDLQKAGPGSSSKKKVYELIKERIHNDERPMPPSPQPRLDANELAVLDGWLAAGAQSSNARCAAAGESPPEAVKPLTCTPDTPLRGSKPFTMTPAAPDQYVCFGVDVELEKKRHVTALAPHVDNKDIVHHILLFQTENSESPDPFPCPSLGSAAWKLVAGWAPGADNFVLPDEAGFPEEKGTTHWVVQIHYNTTKSATGTDASGYDLCSTDELRPNDAGIIGLGSTTFKIPPRTTYTTRCDYRLGADFKDVTFFNAWPHMHTFGSAMSTERLAGGNGTPERIFEQKAFTFESQINFPIEERVTTGDVMRTRCTWKNTTDATVGFGERTGDEMCFNFVAYYPMIPNKVVLGVPVFSWMTPAASSSCVDE